MTKLILLHTVVVLHYTHHIKNGMIGQRWGRCQNAQKQFIIKVNYMLILYKPVALCQFTMACIQYVVMIHLSEQVGLIEFGTE